MAPAEAYVPRERALPKGELPGQGPLSTPCGNSGDVRFDELSVNKGRKSSVSLALNRCMVGEVIFLPKAPQPGPKRRPSPNGRI
jgi:hypothetical protein